MTKSEKKESTITYTREDSRRDQKVLFRKVIDQALTNRIWQIKVKDFVTPGNMMLECAKYLSETFYNLSDSSCNTFLEELNEEPIWPAISSFASRSSNASREKIWTKFAKTLLNDSSGSHFSVFSKTNLIIT